MGIFKRIGKMFTAETNSAVDSMEEERRDKLAQQAIREEREKVVSAQSASARTRAEALSAKKRFDAAKAKSDSWQEKAVDLLKQGKAGSMDMEKAKDLAKTALENKAKVDEDLAIHESTYNQAKSTADQFEKQVIALQRKVGDLEREFKTLKNRSALAASRAEIAEQLNAFNDSGARSMLDKMREKADANEALAEAHNHIEESSKSDETKIDEALAKSKTNSIDADLEALLEKA